MKLAKNPTIANMPWRKGFLTGAMTRQIVIAATRQGGMPVWVVTAGSEEGLPAIVPAMTPELLAHHYAAVVFDGRIASIPLPGGGSR